MATPLIHQTRIVITRKRQRNPIIQQKKEAYVRRRKKEMRKIFVLEYKRRLPIAVSERGLYRRGKFKIWSQRALEIGKQVHEYFGYSKTTNVEDVLSHFRTVYKRMYPHEF